MNITLSPEEKKKTTSVNDLKLKCKVITAFMKPPMSIQSLICGRERHFAIA